MTLHRSYRKEIEFVCDACGDTLETGYADFIDALKCVRERGWAPHKAAEGTWEHYCPRCAPKHVVADFFD